MHRGCFVWTLTPPLAGRRTPRPGPARVCVCLLFLAGSGRPAFWARCGAPYLFLWPLWLSASLGRSVPCVFLFFLLVCAPVVSRFLRFPAPGALGLGAVLCVFFSSRLSASCAPSLFFSFLLGRWLLLGAWCPPPLPVCLAGFVAAARVVAPPPFFFPACAPVVFGFLWFPAPGALGLGAVFCLLCGPPASRLSVRSLLFLCLAWPLVAPWCCCPPPPLPLGAPFFFFFLRCAPPFSPAFSGFRPRVPCASALRVVCFVGLPLLGSPCVLGSLVPPVWPLAAPRWLLPPPPFLCLAVFVASARYCAPCVVLCCVSRVAVLRCAAARCVARCCAVVCCVVLLRSVGAAARRALPSGAPRRHRPCALRRSVLRCSPALCVFCRCVVVCAVVRRSALCCVCPWVLCCAFPVNSALCDAVLHCAGALALCCSCGACCCWRPVLWCAAVCCAVSHGVLWCSAGSGVVCWCRAVAPCCPFLCLWCGFVSLPCVCGVVLRCAWFRLRLRCCWCLVLWRVPVCCGVSLGVLRCGGAALVCRGVLLCCALSCGVLRPVLCPAVLCCLAVLCWWAVLCRCLRCWCLFFILSSFPLLNTPAPPRGRPSATPTTPSQVGSRNRTAPPQARQTEQGTGAGHAEGHGRRGTALPAPSAGSARGAHATPPRRGGSRRRGSASAHTRKGHAGTTRRATGPSTRNAQTAWNGVPASEGKGHPDGTAHHTQRGTRGAGRGKRERHNTRYWPEPPEPAASAAHTQRGHCTRPNP